MKTILRSALILGLALLNGSNYGMKDVKTQKESTAQSLSTDDQPLATTPTMPVSAILLLAPEAPEKVKREVQDWFARNPMVARTALDYEPIIGPLQSFHTMANIALKLAGKDNKSNFNYVVPVGEYWVKMAGHVNRKENLAMMAGDFGQKYQWGRLLTKQDYLAFEKNLKEEEFDKHEIGTVMKTAPKTYQSISRMAHYILFKDAQGLGIIAPNMKAPDMYLVHIPDRPEELSDRNYAIVEKQINNLERITRLTAQEAEAIRKVIETIGLFDCSKDNVKRDAQGNIVFIDFEQPNNSNPRQFFHTVDWVFKNNVKAGLESFEKHFKQELDALKASNQTTAAAK
jgi:hypothetical protein